ncbi:MAG TPA: EamA family transporter [Acidimicrobiia bacterium]|nr:EamA family transporter [Acidimicrobiia bacterium]
MHSAAVRRGDLLALSSAVLFGVSGTIAADAFASFDPTQIAQFRSVVAALVLGWIAWRRHQMATAGNLRMLALLGLFLAAVTINFYWAIERLGVGPGVTIQFLGPSLVLVWMRTVQRRSVPLSAWLAALASLAGTGMITRAWEYRALDPAGVMAGLGAAVSLAGYLITGEYLGRRLPGITVGAYGFGISALILLATAPIQLPISDLVGWTQLMWIAIGGTVVPFMMSLTALRVADPGRVGVLQSFEPAVGAGSAWIVLGQTLTGVQVVGGLVVVISVAVIQYLTSNVAPDAPSPHPI